MNNDKKDTIIFIFFILVYAKRYKFVCRYKKIYVILILFLFCYDWKYAVNNC